MWLVGKDYRPKQTQPRTGLLRGDRHRLSGRAGPHLFSVLPSNRCRQVPAPIAALRLRRRVIRHSPAARRRHPGGNGLHWGSAVPLAWRWRYTRQVPSVFAIAPLEPGCGTRGAALFPTLNHQHQMRELVAAETAAKADVDAAD